MTKTEQIRKLCKDIMSQQRSKAAHVFDFIGLRLLSLLGLFLVFRMLLPQIWGAIFLAVLGTAMLSLAVFMVHNTRLERFIERTRSEFTQKLLLERLMVMSRKDLRAWCARLAWRTGGYRVVGATEDGLIVERFRERILFTLLQRHPQSRLTPQDVLEFYHAVVRAQVSAGVLLSTAPVSEDCKPFLARLERDITLCGPERVLRLSSGMDFMPDEDTLNSELILELKARHAANKEKFQNFRKQILLPAKARRYGLCGLIILLGGILIGQTLYYAVFASACFGLALLSLIRGRRESA